MYVAEPLVVLGHCHSRCIQEQELGNLVYTCNASIQENKVGGSGAQGQLGLWSIVLLLKGKKRRKIKGASERI